MKGPVSKEFKQLDQSQQIQVYKSIREDNTPAERKESHVLTYLFSPRYNSLLHFQTKKTIVLCAPQPLRSASVSICVSNLLSPNQRVKRVKRRSPSPTKIPTLI